MITLEEFNARGAGCLPGHLGMAVLQAARGELKAEMQIRQMHMAPNGYLHAGAIVTLADTCAGYGCIASLPEGATGFTTIELKSNHLATARDGMLDCTAKAVHLGRTTQVWDSVVTHRDSGKTIALFRCTQLLIYPKAGA